FDRPTSGWLASRSGIRRQWRVCWHRDSRIDRAGQSIRPHLVAQYSSRHVVASGGNCGRAWWRHTLAFTIGPAPVCARSGRKRPQMFQRWPVMTRRRLLPAIVVAGLAVAGAAAEQQRPRIPPTGAIKSVRDNLYVIPGVGGNTTVFVTQGGVVLVDTKLPNNGEAILNQVRTVTDKPVSMIINTHSHPDPIGSNEYFPASVEVIAHENTRKWMAANPRVATNAAAMPDLAGIPRLRAVQSRAGRRRDRRHGEEDRRADRGGAE